MDSDTHEALMRATYRALCRHGYAAVTMQKIADESDKCKGTLHYHYESKQDLLESFLAYLRDGFVERVAVDDDLPPAERLRALVDVVLSPPERRHQAEFQTAILEIKAQAPYTEGYRDLLADIDGHVHRSVADVVSEGVETGAFRSDADPDDVADFVVTILNGAHARHVVEGDLPEHTKRHLWEYLERSLGLDRGVPAE